MKRFAIITAVALAIPLSTHSQTGIPSAVVHGLHGDMISLRGDIGTYGELYSISGRDSRRPSSTARLYFRPTLAFYDAMTMSFNFLLSTEGSSRSAQHQLNQINQLGIRPQWEWGYANAGDFTESFTPYTLNGILIRGGGVTIKPGLFRFSAVGGYTRRTSAGTGQGNFDRYLYGGKIGIGRDSDSFFDVLFVRARDIPSRFQIIQPDSVSPPDSTQVGTTINPYQETPQENLVVGAVGALKLFENAMTVNAEFSGSAFTRDMTSTQFDNEKIPSLVRNIFTPRLSSSVDYAYSATMNSTFDWIGFKAGYRYIGPGYNSLGVASLITDQREIMLGTNMRFVDWSTNFTWTRQNDNLLDQKLHTTIRQTFAGNLSFRPAGIWNVSLLGNVLTMRNYAGSDTALVRFATISTGANQSLMLGRNGLFRLVSLTYMFNKSSDENPLRANSGSVSHTFTGNTSMSPAKDLTIIPSLSIVRSRIGLQSWMSIDTYSLTSQLVLLQNDLVTSVTIGLSKAQSTSSLQANMITTYRLTQHNTLTLSVRRTGFNGDAHAGNDYSEYVASLTVLQKL